MMSSKRKATHDQAMGRPKAQKRASLSRVEQLKEECRALGLALDTENDIAIARRVALRPGTRIEVEWEVDGDYDYSNKKWFPATITERAERCAYDAKDDDALRVALRYDTEYATEDWEDHDERKSRDEDSFLEVWGSDVDSLLKNKGARAAVDVAVPSVPGGHLCKARMRLIRGQDEPVVYWV